MESSIRRYTTFARGIVLLLAVGIGVPLLAFHQVRVALVTLPLPPAG